MMTLRQSNLFDLLLWLARLRRRVRVTGASMSPLLRPGDEVLFAPRAYRRRAPRAGEIVIVRHPEREGVKMVKRVTAVLPHDHYQIRGDNPAASTDSRTFGPVPREQILGQVISRFG